MTLKDDSSEIKTVHLTAGQFKSMKLFVNYMEVLQRSAMEHSWVSQNINQAQQFPNTENDKEKKTRL